MPVISTLRSFFGSLYLDSRFFVGAGVVVGGLLVAFILPALLPVAQYAAAALALLLVFDIVILFTGGGANGIRVVRDAPERLSNGDDNEIRLYVESDYRISISARVIEELPFQFQKRDAYYNITIAPCGSAVVSYIVRPVKRGEYGFGNTNVFAASPLRLARRRFRAAAAVNIPVYPSYLQMRRYELMAISDRLVEVGLKRMRRVGQTMEFDQIREYVQGDDYRRINWRATARRSQPMVNQFQDERSQQVYCVIDKGRTMQMPFDGMALLDYAINTSLVISNIALMKEDRAGLLTFAERIGAFLPAERRRSHMRNIQEALYNQKTRYLEANYEALHNIIRRRITTRSLILLFTNFETLSSMERNLASLRSIARDHLLVVIFFENTELRSFLESSAQTLEDVYLLTIGEKLAFEKRRIVKELARHGVLSILTTPQNLTVDALNKYMEIKARRMI